MSKIKFYKDSAKTQQVYPELDPEDITKFESLEDIENAFPNVSGEDTTLTLNHTVEAPMRLELAPSELEQATTTGKNLLNKELFTSLEKISSSAIIDTGVEFTTTNEASSSTYGRIMATTPLDSSKTYTISCDVTSNNTGRFLFGYLGTTGGSLVANITANTKTSVSYQLSNITSSVISLGFYLENTTVKVENLMIVEGTTVGDYEPYTGGYPQPNPDFPSQVHSVSGDNDIKIKGKNIFNLNDTHYTRYTTNFTVRIEQNSVYVKNSTGYGNGFVWWNIPVTIGKSITISYVDIIEATTSDNNKMQYKFSEEAITSYSSDLSANFLSISKTDKNITAEATNKYLILCLRTSNSGEYTINNIQVEYNDMQTSYESYQEKSYPINLPVENLFNKDNANILNGYYLDGTTHTIKSATAGKTLYISIKSNTTYTVSKVSSARFTVGTTNEIPQLNVSYYNYVTNNNGTKITITSDNNSKYLCVFYYANGTDTLTEQEILDTIQIEEGSKANSYTPFGTQSIEYCKIGDYSDEFFKNDPSDPNYDSSLELDRWYLKKNFGKAILNGGENYTQSTKEGFSYFLYTANAGRFPGYARIGGNTVIFNKFKGGNNVAGTANVFNQGNNICCFRYNSGDTLNNFYITSSINNVADFKADLTNNNAVGYYVLAQPQYILLSDTLQHQLDDIYNWVESYPEQTNIFQINNDLPFIISAHAMRDLSIIDKYPTENSEHLVESGGVYEVINDLDVVQDEHTTQIKELQRASLIYNAMPKVTGSGTNLTLDNTVESPLEIDLGASILKQESTNGYQMIHQPSSESTSERNDLIFKSFPNGNLSVIGTASANTQMFFNISTGQFLQSNPNNTLEAGTYSIKYTEISGTMDFNIRIRSGITDIIIMTQGTNTFTLNEDISNFNIYFYTSSNISRNTTFKLMLEKGSTSHDWEKYTGGNPAPSPDFPQQIHSVSGDNEIKVEGKNLFDITAFENQLVTGKILNDSGVEVNDATSTYSKYVIPVKANTTYYRKGAWQRMYVYDKNMTLLTRGSAASGFNSSFTVEQDGYIGFQVSDTYWTSNKGQEQIELSSTATEYEPYISRTFPINLKSKNLFDKNNAIDGKEITNTQTGEIGNNENWFITNYIKIEPNTAYTVSGKQNGNAILYYDSNKTFTTGISTGGTETFTTPNNVSYAVLNGLISEKDTFQLEKGSQATQYANYYSPIELCKIGNDKDYFYKNIPGASDYSSDRDEGAWYLHKKIGKIVLDGDENISQNSATFDNVIRYSLQQSAIIYLMYKQDGYCNQLPILNSFVNDSEHTYIYNGVLYLFYNKNRIANLNALKTYLSTNNFILYARLATPTYTKITDSTLISQLEDISMAISYQTQTNISQTNNDLPFNIDATAVLDLNTLIDAIVSLGGNI